MKSNLSLTLPSPPQGGEGKHIEEEIPSPSMGEGVKK
jgi:hypothetical protein